MIQVSAITDGEIHSYRCLDCGKSIESPKKFRPYPPPCESCDGVLLEVA